MPTPTQLQYRSLAWKELRNFLKGVGILILWLAGLIAALMLTMLAIGLGVTLFPNANHALVAAVPMATIIGLCIFVFFRGNSAEDIKSQLRETWATLKIKLQGLAVIAVLACVVAAGDWAHDKYKAWANSKQAERCAELQACTTGSHCALTVAELTEFNRDCTK